ncbi:MAG: transmembrane HD family protein [Bacteroidia bacterium]|nr:MAG: transmembrane HD family protein [Bacteroidia bacterium]PIE86456.1 MAG: transmembrane HD family protein [Bacteroidia bacterium]
MAHGGAYFENLCFKTATYTHIYLTDMNTFWKNIKQKYYRPIVVIMFLIAVGIIVYLFPQERKFRYEFRKGAPWQHEDLIAPYDFPIYKTAAELKAEKDSIVKRFSSYFKYDTSVETSQKKFFRNNFYQKWQRQRQLYDSLKLQNKFVEQLADSVYNKKIKSEYFSKIIGILHLLYSNGIIEYSDGNADQTIVIMRENVAEEYDLEDFFTLKSAYEYLFSHLDVSDKTNDALREEKINFIKTLDLNEYLLPNLFYDEKTSKKVKKSLIDAISITTGMVQENQGIIFRGEVVNDEKFRILESLKREYESTIGNTRNFYFLILGQLIFAFATFLMLYLFLHTFRKDIIRDVKTMSFILLLILLFFSIGKIVINTAAVSIYLIPFVIVPIIIRIFFDTRLALFSHLTTIILVGFLAPNGFEFLFLHFIAGVVSIISLKNLRRRGQLFTTSVLILATYFFIYFGLAIIQEGDISKIKTTNFAWFIGNGLLILLTYPLIYVFERTFGFLSDVTLIEISDSNSGIMRMLAEKAPGTFQHSMQVANLAEEAIYSINGNPLLTRAGALYHDIGKLEMSQFFVENQLSGINPHDQMDFETSASVIISHVTKGVELAQKHKVPSQIIDFIRMHHGTGKTQYFLRSFINKYPEKKVDEAKFTYPGPKPNSKETAVVMMADSIEAASRSLKILKEDSISKLVDKIIDYQIREDQFSDSNLTFRDITTVKSIFKQKLKNIYHARIEYPEEKKASK